MKGSSDLDLHIHFIANFYTSPLLSDYIANGEMEESREIPDLFSLKFKICTARIGDLLIKHLGDGSFYRALGYGG